MKEFDTEHFHMLVHESGLVEFKVKKGIVLNEADVWKSQELSLSVLPGKKLFVLTEAEGEFNPAPDAKRAGASEKYARHVAAHALCSDNLTLKILGNLFISISKPKVLTRFFEDRNDALLWLKIQMQKKA